LKRPPRVSVHELLWYLLTSCLLLHQLLQVRRLQKTKEDPDDPEAADEGDIQMEYSSDYLYSPSIGTGTKKNTFKNVVWYR
jgi:hypothetical protein